MRMGIRIAVAVLAAAGAVRAGEEEGVSLTAYGAGFGVVRDIRKLDIGADGRVKVTDIAAGVDTTSVHFKSLTDPAAKVIEQNFQYDLVNAAGLLEKNLDARIDVLCRGGATYGGSLLSYDDNYLVLREEPPADLVARLGADHKDVKAARAKCGIAMVGRGNVQDVRFSTLPKGMLTQPTLLWQVATGKPGTHLAELTYQTRGVAWHAEYVLLINAADTAADVSGWVSVNNTSGKTFRDARLKFVGGDVKKIADPVDEKSSDSGLFGAGGSDSKETAVQQKPFFEYHMYTLPRRSTVANNETKQLELFNPVAAVKVQKRYLYNPLGAVRWDDGNRAEDKSYGLSSEKKVNLFIELVNSKDNRLGIPLPAGKMRVYKEDPADKAHEFIGEEVIDHTPENEKLSLQIGNAFDIVGQRRQVSFQWTQDERWAEEAVEITLRNHKKEAVTVRCKEPMYRYVNWEIKAKSDPFEKLDDRTVIFDVKADPEKEKVVTYTVRYTW